MSRRQQYMIPHDTPNNSQIAEKLRYLASLLDSADYCETVFPVAAFSEESSKEDLPNTWMLIALLIADELDMPTPRLIAIANAVFKGEQSAFAF